MIKKIFKYIFYFILFVIAALILLMVYPKGDLATQLKNKNVPAIGYAIIENGEIVESKVIGELEAGKPAPQNAIFNVASVTKPVFATMIMNLIDDGAIELDSPVHPYWTDPDIASDKRHQQLTPRILLSHSSGFPNWRWFNPDGKLSFWHDPGTTYQYSGEGMEYMKKTAENKLNTPLIPLMDSLIFKPAGMMDTRMVWDSVLHEERLAKFHDREAKLYEMKKRTSPVASDDLCTTTDDLANFVLYLINEKGGLSDAAYEEMITINTPINDRSGYGLGWQVAPDLPDDNYALVHGGSDIGVRARIVILPKSKSGFVAFVNGDNGQQIIDRLMVDRLKYGDDILAKIYAPLIWRIIHLPFDLPF